MPRPISWPTKITAAPEAVAFYKALAVAAEAGVFADCHVYTGALNKLGVPVLTDPGSKQPLPGAVIVAAYLGEAVSGRRRCATRGCLNPFHYATVSQPAALFPSVMDVPELNRDTAGQMREWIDLVDYLRKKHETKQVSIPWLRRFINEEDIPDDMLHQVFHKLPEDWKV